MQYVVDSHGSVNARDGWIRVGSKYILIHQDADDSGDSTPPIITPTITGTQVNGWYTSDVTITWSVKNPDSEIIEQLGCDSPEPGMVLRFGIARPSACGFLT